ncbi:hypothetical protein [Psychroserpens sp.]|uniref:hypothetical protein n=1 Tax=Psychroserpens sp. TaxID=2020870 RepID=UPI001B0F2A67|nr:hypothetical protein [Psychroserpens sp.]MBO6606112.1 hypothetical protein [Psychroserpens sp.]MBO6630620.1 hypothetical protein [Psychroserpens sp.]MBO6652517.1 hypothetical protein [Psychroserpens sp.]MBO6681711.1 hypothetical protein [Psychroserpens sp.]MBO6749486.1 hypothetical protein [Psychroserpens sp.]
MIKSIRITLLILSMLYFSNVCAQSNDYIVKSGNDTVYIDKIKLKYDKIKVKYKNENITYSFDKINCFYLSKSEELHVKVKSPNAHMENARKEIFMIRLTNNGKVNLLKYSESGTGFSGGIETYKLCFINILNSKPELIDIPSDNGIFKESLSYEAFIQLKDYLYGNTEILKTLDNLRTKKHKKLTDKIIAVINDYNAWESTKS